MRFEDGVDGQFPPLNVGPRTDGLLVPMENGNRMRSRSQLHAMGDLRGNESPLLFAFHTLWLREHNRLAATMQGSDEEIFQRARALCIGFMQHIFINEPVTELLRAPG